MSQNPVDFYLNKYSSVIDAQSVLAQPMRVRHLTAMWRCSRIRLSKTHSHIYSSGGMAARKQTAIL